MHDVYVYSTIVIKSSVYTLTQWDTYTFLETCYANTGSWPVEYTQLHVGKSQATVPVHTYTGKVYTKCSVCVSFYLYELCKSSNSRINFYHTIRYTENI